MIDYDQSRFDKEFFNIWIYSRRKNVDEILFENDENSTRKV